MSITIPEGLVVLEGLFRDKSTGLDWPQVFSLPGWMSAWWRQFGAGYEPMVLVLQDGGRMLGVAPLKCREGVASFIGDGAVCDYLDFVVVPGREEAFSEMLLRVCGERGIIGLELETMRPDSVAMRHVLPFAHGCGLGIEFAETEESYETYLPTSFETYLDKLASQQRREVLRKQRRLDGLGRSAFRMLEGDKVDDLGVETLIGLMAESRRDKADFLTDGMRFYFKDMARAMASYGFLRLGFLDIGVKTVAGVLGFDYGATLYLYNSGYDPSYAEFGVGLFSKLAAVRWAIERHKTTFDFLKGSEPYKERLGGRRVELTACRLALG